eukprot:80618_1
MYVFLKTWKGDVYSVTITKHEFMYDIKVKLFNLSKILPSHARFIWAGKQLNDYKTVNEYKITYESTIHVILKTTVPQNKNNLLLFQNLTIANLQKQNKYTKDIINEHQLLCSGYVRKALCIVPNDIISSICIFIHLEWSIIIGKRLY